MSYGNTVERRLSGAQLPVEWIIRGLRLSLICKVSCKEALTAAVTLLYFMENQHDVDYVELLQIRGYIRKIIISNLRARSETVVKSTCHASPF
jgi:hypothetical protein